MTHSDVKKHSVRLRGHATSISMEDAFWRHLRAIAKAEGKSLNALIAEIDDKRIETGGGNLSSALRLRVLAWLEQKAR